MAEPREHKYAVDVRWTGNLGSGTADYGAYSRTYEISADNKKDVLIGSAPGPFGGDESLYNPEDAFVAALSSCHMLWYLMLCAEAQVIVEEYLDQPSGTMVQTADGGGRFTEVVLHPRVTVRDPSSVQLAEQLHEVAHDRCFIANSANFPIRCEPHIESVDG